MVVSVAICAGRAIAVVAHRARTAQALVAQFSLLKVLTVRFMVVLLCLTRISIFGCWRAYGTTRKDALLESVPLGVTTWTFPLVAPAVTVVVISELETTVKTAAVPLKLTLVAPVRLVPRILTAAPTLPKGGRGFTNGPRPTDRRNTVPPLLAPP